MSKAVRLLVLIFMSFIGTILNNICWYILLFFVSGVVPNDMEIVANIFVTCCLILIHFWIYIKIYKKYYKKMLKPIAFFALCIVPYIVLLILAVYWFMTFPFL